MKNYHVANRLLGAAAALLMTIGLPPGGPVVSAGGFREEALDAGVRAAVRAQLGIAGDTALTQADMEGLERLSIRKMGVKSLEGLEYAVNLEWLDVSGNPELQRIPEGWLDALPALSYLNLSGSSLTDFPAALYAGRLSAWEDQLRQAEWEETTGGWNTDDLPRFTLVMKQMPPLRMLWTDMRRAQAAFEAVQAKADAMTPEGEEACAPAEVQALIGLKLSYPSRFDDVQIRGGALIRLTDTILSQGNLTEREAEALGVMGLTAAELYAYPLPEGTTLGEMNATGQSIRDLLGRDFNTLLPLLSRELTLDVLKAAAESAGLRVQDSYPDLNGFFADLLGQQGWTYAPGDPVGSALLTMLSETAREMGLPVFTDLPNAFVAVLAERLGMDWNGRTLMGEMLADLMDVPWEKLTGQLPGAAPGEETGRTLGELLEDSLAGENPNATLYLVKAEVGDDPAVIRMHHPDRENLNVTARLDGRTLPVTDEGDGYFYVEVPRRAGSYTLEIQAVSTKEPLTFEGLEEDDSSYSYRMQVRVMAPPSQKCALNSFELAGARGTIDEAAKTVQVTLPKGTDLTALTPRLTVSDKASHNVNGPLDFTKPVQILVTAEDGVHTARYTVTVQVENGAPKGTDPVSASSPPDTGERALTGCLTLAAAALGTARISRRKRL
ncbi:DUF5018 domain-containing protein [Anaeromassilibacillus sp. SJQ-5]